MVFYSFRSISGQPTARNIKLQDVYEKQVLENLLYRKIQPFKKGRGYLCRHGI